MRNLILSSAAAVALLVASPAVSAAPVECINCATLPVQLEQQAQDLWNWGQSLIYQVQAVEQQIQTVQYAIQNTLSLPGRLRDDLMSPIYQAQAMVRQAEMLSQQTKWMITNLNGGGYGGYGGSLADIPNALRQETAAVSNAMQTLGLVSRQVSALSSSCTAQYAGIDAYDPGGVKAATMAGTTIAATSGQCAEARAQLQAAYQNAMATAELQRAHREAMAAAASQAHLDATLRSTCASLSSGGGSSWACQQQSGASGQ